MAYAAEMDGPVLLLQRPVQMDRPELPVLRAPTVVMGLAFEVVADKIGGEVAGKVLSGAGSVLKKMKPWLARAGSSIQFRGKTISFDSMGFPNFSPFVHDRVQIRMTGNNSRDQFLADTEFFQKGGVKPPGEWVWHHSQDLTTMELIPFEVNDAVRHMGGASIIRTMLDD